MFCFPNKLIQPLGEDIVVCVGLAHTGLPVMLLRGYQMYLEVKQLYALSESHL